MAIIIRHGSNGGYKTAATVQDSLIPAIKEGRHVVTNIRGVSRERAFEKMPHEANEKFDVTFIDTETREGKEKAARWFHWVPKGALLLFDEASSLFPKKWSVKDIDRLAYEGGPDKAKQDDRPEDWLSAWEMHRHWNWDIVLTTPNIKGIRDDIRNTTEMAYKHRNMATMGAMFKGRFKEAMHDASNNGTSPSNFITINTRKINKKSFELYQSTSTGDIKDTTAGKSIFNSIPLMVGLGVLAFCIIFIISNGGYNLFGHKAVQSDSENPFYDDLSSREMGNTRSPSQAPDVRNGSLPIQPVNQNDSIEPFNQFHVWLSGVIVTNDRAKVYFDVKMDETITQYSNIELERMGYEVRAFNQCFAVLVYEGIKRNIYCDAPQEKEKPLTDDSLV